MEKYRMYSLVMYNISPIQQGIQAGHAWVDYTVKHIEDNDLQYWARNDKTVIILNGGTSNCGESSLHGLTVDTPNTLGTMEQHYQWLKSNGTKAVAFNEPDLNNSLSAIAFLVPEQVFNKKDFPDINLIEISGLPIGYQTKPYHEVIEFLLNGGIESSNFDNWVESIGGAGNVRLRLFLSKFRLA